MLKVFNIAVLFGLLSACHSPAESENPDALFQERPKNPRESNIEAHRRFLKKEIESIKSYIEERDLNLKRNGTGIHYQIMGENGRGPLAQSGQLVTYHYEISLLNGSLLYASEEGQAAQLLIDRQDAEIGLHDALKLMRVGDKGFFILPSHRAFGVAGDQNKVPPFTALVYKLEVLEIQNQKQQKWETFGWPLS